MFISKYYVKVFVQTKKQNTTLISSKILRRQVMIIVIKQINENKY